ncbi:hypothetical protein Z517_06445 [Fonsecaea pedrosoi CBS 271.37]|uniref:Uncharacterized protein n=1 Tax=Fonsecaea pedrosoi CBS 271.37 TaxID=1442368 RepID=A0A0D2GMR4_9EURO|nr:uncharacterized protein Z517_06445 [Fonsecaea pedrosoi CBS 271.37]KIW79830.1 hypothetical protein Z517_06445 [Fonsecaea pedrosoi CBS 271.37]
MADRRSDSYDGVAEEANIALRVKPKDMRQLSSSSDAVKAKRIQKPLESLQKAARKVEGEAREEGTGQKKLDALDKPARKAEGEAREEGTGQKKLDALDRPARKAGGAAREVGTSQK